MTQVNARIDKDIYDRLAEASALTNVPVSRCIAEACEIWLTAVAPARIEARQRPVFAGGVFAVSNDSHPHVKMTDVIAQCEEREQAKVKK